MTAVVGLDLSLTSTGIAGRRGPSIITSNKKGVHRLFELRQKIHGYLIVEPVDLVVIEGYSFGSHSSHAHELGELGGVVRVCLQEHGITFVDVPPTSLKKYATGKGQAKKELVLVEAVKRLGYGGASKDEADALWLQAMGLDAMGEPVVEVPAAHREALRSIAWPEVSARAGAW